MRISRRWVQNLCVVCMPAALIATLNQCVGIKPNTHDKVPPPSATYHSNDDELAHVKHRNELRQVIIENMLSGGLEIGKAFDEFFILNEYDKKNQIGLRVIYGDRPLEELAALNLLRYLENYRSDPRAAERIVLARCEYEDRFGPQVWMMMDQYFVVPHPVE